jgi:hypothetical protein
MPVFNIVNLRLACLLPRSLVTSLPLLLLLLLPPWLLDPLVSLAAICTCLVCACVVFVLFMNDFVAAAAARGTRSRTSAFVREVVILAAAVIGRSVHGERSVKLPRRS